VTPAEETETDLTTEGAILGTVAYMSPEQAEGKPVDARSDIFSFGTLLYEMVTGRSPFERESKISTLNAILKEEPKPAREVASHVPPELAQIISRCLRKDPARRFQHIADVKVLLEELRQEPGASAPQPAMPRRRRRWVWPSVAIAAVLALVLVWWLREPSAAGELRAVPLTSYPGRQYSPSLSPDGNRLAFVWNGEKQDIYQIYVMQIGGALPCGSRIIQGGPSAWRGRRTTGRLPSSGGSKEIGSPSCWSRLSAGRSASSAEVSAIPVGLSWTPDAKWLAFAAPNSPGEPHSIWVVSVDTGERRRLTVPRVAPGAFGDATPSFSPDGRMLAFGREEKAYVVRPYALSLSRDLRPEGEPRRLTDRFYATGTGIAWTPTAGKSCLVRAPSRRTCCGGWPSPGGAIPPPAIRH